MKDNWPRRYKAAYEKVYSELPYWKKQLIDDKSDRHCNDFAKNVIKYAEQQKEPDSLVQKMLKAKQANKNLEF